MRERRLKFNYKYNQDKRLLYKEEKEANMLWERGGYPAINKEVADALKGIASWIGVKTQKRKFIINAKFFFDNAEVTQHEGYEPQYFVDWEYFGRVEKLDQPKLV